MAGSTRKKVTIKELHRKKAAGEMITSLGVYDAPMAAIADNVGFDLLINGNAGPMSLLAHRDPTTVPYMDQLILTQAVSRVVKYGMVVSHLPYMTYNVSAPDSVRNAARMISEGGADAVKCEGNAYIARTFVEPIVQAGIPVMAHLGLMASRKLEQSGYGVKGRKAEEALEIVKAARAFAESGAFAILIEQTPEEVAAYLAESLPIPVIGLVAGRRCDGIYDISGDMLGYSAFPAPKAKRTFADLRGAIDQGLRAYLAESLAGNHPTDESIPHMTEEEHARFLEVVDK